MPRDDTRLNEHRVGVKCVPWTRVISYIELSGGLCLSCNINKFSWAYYRCRISTVFLNSHDFVFFGIIIGMIVSTCCYAKSLSSMALWIILTKQHALFIVCSVNFPKKIFVYFLLTKQAFKDFQTFRAMTCVFVGSLAQSRWNRPLRERNRNATSGSRIFQFATGS